MGYWEVSSLRRRRNCKIEVLSCFTTKHYGEFLHTFLIIITFTDGILYADLGLDVNRLVVNPLRRCLGLGFLKGSCRNIVKYPPSTFTEEFI